MTFDIQKFKGFCANIQINSKEFGTIKLDKLYGPQRWWVHSIGHGLEEGVHDFTCLKCRQVGLSTVSLALDLYWPFTHEGLDGTIITQDEETHDNFRTQLTEYYKSLPKRLKPRAGPHNRNQFVFRHKNTISRLQYQIAGTRASSKGGKLGRAKGNAFVHATEMAFWGDQQGYSSLRNALAETNPNRLYIWESTANGYNQFEEQWRVAQKSITQRAIFVSWWAHEMYRVERDSDIFKTYWGVDGRMTKEEARLSRDVALLYGDAMEFVWGRKEISPEQIAWFRWYSEEKVADPDMVLQEMPWTEHQAFVVTGAQYFKSHDLTQAHRRITREGPASYFKIEVGHTLTDCQVLQMPRKTANLVVYEAPVAGAQYVLGADPAYGSSEWADRYVVSVWRAYADRLVQVAEFADPNLMSYSFAWIIAYLAGCYAPCAWNLEVNGPGGAVLGEIDNLRKQQFSGNPQDRATMKNFLGGMKEFLYTRADQISKAPTARGTSSTLKEKKRYFELFKGYFARGMVEPHSRDLIDEMKWVAEEPGFAPKATGRHKDDRVIGACLATSMWHDKLRQQLTIRGMTYESAQKKEAPRQVSVFQALTARQVALLTRAPAAISRQPQGRRRGRR